MKKMKKDESDSSIVNKTIDNVSESRHRYSTDISLDL